MGKANSLFACNLFANIYWFHPVHSIPFTELHPVPSGQCNWQATSSSKVRLSISFGIWELFHLYWVEILLEVIPVSCISCLQQKNARLSYKYLPVCLYWCYQLYLPQLPSCAWSDAVIFFPFLSFKQVLDFMFYWFNEQREGATSQKRIFCASQDHGWAEAKL